MFKPFEFDYLIQAITAVHFLEHSTSGHGGDTSNAIKLLSRFFAVTDSQPYWFYLLVEIYDQKTAPGCFDDLMGRLLYSFPDNLRYQFAGFLACRAVDVGDFRKMPDYYPHLLVEDRHLVSSTESAEIVDASEYDNFIHADGARKLCFFALLSDLESIKRNGLRVLDIGCGTGLNSEFIIRYTSHLTGLDLNLSALRKAGRAKRYDVTKEGDARDTIGDIEGPFDLIISTGAIYFFRDLEWLFFYAARLLSPTGQLVFNAFPAPDGKDVYVTRSGNFRYCHSLEYLRRTSRACGLDISQQKWTTCYGLPVWFLRFTRQEAAVAHRGA